jgi:hypothetical protein
MQALSQVVDVLSEVLEETLRKCDAYAAAKQLASYRVRILSVTRAVYDCMQSLLEVASEGQDATELAARGKMMLIAEAKKKMHAKQPPSKRR